VAQNLERLATAKKTIEEAHPSTKVYTFSTAIDDAEKVKSMFAEVREQVEPDVLVRNAGMGNKPSPTLNIPVDEFWKRIEINVKANMSFVAEFLKPDTMTKAKDYSERLNYNRSHPPTWLGALWG